MLNKSYLRMLLMTFVGFLVIQLLSACSIPLGSFTFSLPAPMASTQPPSPWQQLFPSVTDQAEEEQELYRLLNDYRAEKGLPAIPYSDKLALTARTHSQDLMRHRPDEELAPDGSPCNLHSWSPHGTWTPVCYTADHRQAAKLWSKPREVAGYKGDGFEISAYSNGCRLAECFLKQWQGSPGHNALMVNTGKWASVEWKAVGVGIDGDYANIWFGEVQD